MWSRHAAGLALALVAAAIGATSDATRRQTPVTTAPNDTGPRDLPLHEVTAASRGPWLGVMITGDRGWVGDDRDLAGALADRGVAVVALDVRSYLRAKRSPDAAAHDVDRVVRHYTRWWGRPRVVLVGYSRGADMMPFVANRLPADSKARVGLLALVGLEQRASFELHWTDLVLNRTRATDLPVLPELERLRGLRMLCVYGEDERDSMCRSLDPQLATPIVHAGPRQLKGRSAPDLARLIVGALPG